MSLLEVNRVNTGYGNKQVLFDVSLNVEEGDIVLLIGSNGSGKSTLLKAICGMTPTWSGSVGFEGRILQGEKVVSPTSSLLRQGILYIPQKNALFEDASVKENLEFSLLHLSNRKKIGARIDEVLETIPSLKPLLKQQASRLSGGEKKMLSLGMVMANRPKLLLYDEPLAGVSEDNIPQVLDILGKLSKDGTTMLIVEHHVLEMMQFAHKTYGLRLGRMADEELHSIEQIKEIMI